LGIGWFKLTEQLTSSPEFKALPADEQKYLLQEFPLLLRGFHSGFVAIKGFSVRAGFCASVYHRHEASS
jgi:hypothetical protein